MSYIINKAAFTEQTKDKILQGFQRHSMAELGLDEYGFGEEFSFELREDNNEFVGAIVIMPFWGCFRIRLLFVEEKYRGLGLARKLMEHALSFAKEQGYNFATVETLSFQALGFYQKFGFELDFTRTGYSNDVSLHYLSKSL